MRSKYRPSGNLQVLQILCSPPALPKALVFGPMPALWLILGMWKKYTAWLDQAVESYFFQNCVMIKIEKYIECKEAARYECDAVISWLMTRFRGWRLDLLSAEIVSKNRLIGNAKQFREKLATYDREMWQFQNFASTYVKTGQRVWLKSSKIDSIPHPTPRWGPAPTRWTPPGTTVSTTLTFSEPGSDL